RRPMSEPREDTAPPSATAALMARRFRGYLPVAIDVETGGFHPATDALLEIAAVLIDMDSDGALKRGATHNFHVQPFAGGRLDPTSLSITGIDPFHPLRPALPERDALQRVFREIRHALRAYGCRRAILVGHNAAFDLSFLHAAVARAGQAQSLSSVLVLRHRHPRRCGARTDGARQSGDRRGARVGPGQCPQRPLRRAAQRRALLPGVQPPARQPPGRRGAGARAGLVE